MICRALILVVLGTIIYFKTWLVVIFRAIFTNFHISVAAVTADTEPLLCMRYCLQVISDPVCGYNGKVWKTFNSLCDLKNAECSERASKSNALALLNSPALQKFHWFIYSVWSKGFSWVRSSWNHRSYRWSSWANINWQM